MATRVDENGILTVAGWCGSIKLRRPNRTHWSVLQEVCYEASQDIRGVAGGQVAPRWIAGRLELKPDSS